MNDLVRIPVVFTIDKKFLPPAYVAITSLVDNAKKNTSYDIIVLYQGKVDKRVQKLYEVISNSTHKMRIEDISSVKINAPKVSKCWPKVVYVCLYLSSILEAYDKVIFSDVDVLFLGDLSQIFNVDITEYEWGGVAAELNNEEAVMHQYYSDNSHRYIYWTGFMLMNLKKMRESNWEKRCNDNLKKYQNRLFMFDLEIMNLTAKKIKRIPIRYVYLQALYDAADIAKAEEFEWLSKVYTKEELEEEKKKAVIVHYAGVVGNIGKIWLRIKPAEYYNRYLKQLPPQLKWQNSIQKYKENIKVLLKIILGKR